jgi:hypothetical protein
MEAVEVIPLLACSDIAPEHDVLVTVPGFTSAGIERTRTAPSSTQRYGWGRISSGCTAPTIPRGSYRPGRLVQPAAESSFTYQR